MSKSEREKMLAGEGYIALDAELGAMNATAQELLYRFNNSQPSKIYEREEITSQLFGSAGTNCLIKKPFFCDYGSHIYVGDNFFASYDCVILDCNEVRIRNDVMLAPKVQIYPLESEIRRTLVEYAAPIGTGSVVTKSVPPNVFAAGNLCRVIVKFNE